MKVILNLSFFSFVLISNYFRKKLLGNELFWWVEDRAGLTLENVSKYKGTHKGWDFRDDCPEFILFVFLIFRIRCNCKLIFFVAMSIWVLWVSGRLLSLILCWDVWYFPKWQLPKCAIAQAATYQVCPSRSPRPQPVQASSLGTLAHSSCSARSSLQFAAPQRS